MAPMTGVTEHATYDTRSPVFPSRKVEMAITVALPRISRGSFLRCREVQQVSMSSNITYNRYVIKLW